MITIFGTTYFTIGAGLVVLALTAPVWLWFSTWLLRPNVEGKPARVRWLAIGGATLALLLFTAVGLFWDVYLIGQRAKELCAQTGLIIHRTAPAKSFVGSTDIQSWSKDGFDFVENTIRGKRYRMTMLGNKEVRTEVPDFESSYELSTATGLPPSKDSYLDNRFMLLTHTVTERSTGQPLSQLSSLTIGTGWIDALLIEFSGFVAKPHICGKDKNGNVALDGQQVTLGELIRLTLERS